MVFRKLFILFIFVSKLFSANIMIVPLEANYSNEKEASISSDLFDEVNSAVLDSNNYYKKNNIDSTLFLKQSLLPRANHQAIISKFYKNDDNVSYLKKVSNYYNLDILIFMKKKKKKKKLNISVFVYKINAKKILKYSKKVYFDNANYSLDEKAIKKIKDKLVEFITK